MPQDRPLGRDTVDDGQFAINLGRSGDDRLRDIFLDRNLVWWLRPVKGFDLDMTKAMLDQMRLELADGSVGLNIGDQAKIKPCARLVRDDGLGPRPGIARDDTLNICGGS